MSLEWMQNVEYLSTAEYGNNLVILYRNPGTFDAWFHKTHPTPGVWDNNIYAYTIGDGFDTNHVIEYDDISMVTSLEKGLKLDHPEYLANPIILTQCLYLAGVKRDTGGRASMRLPSIMEFPNSPHYYIGVVTNPNVIPDSPLYGKKIGVLGALNYTLCWYNEYAERCLRYHEPSSPFTEAEYQNIEEIRDRYADAYGMLNSFRATYFPMAGGDKFIWPNVDGKYPQLMTLKHSPSYQQSRRCCVRNPDGTSGIVYYEMGH